MHSLARPRKVLFGKKDLQQLRRIFSIQRFADHFVRQMHGSRVVRSHKRECDKVNKKASGRPKDMDDLEQTSRNPARKSSRALGLRGGLFPPLISGEPDSVGYLKTTFSGHRRETGTKLACCLDLEPFSGHSLSLVCGFWEIITVIRVSITIAAATFPPSLTPASFSQGGSSCKPLRQIPDQPDAIFWQHLQQGLLHLLPFPGRFMPGLSRAAAIC